VKALHSIEAGKLVGVLGGEVVTQKQVGSLVQAKKSPTNVQPLYCVLHFQSDENDTSYIFGDATSTNGWYFINHSCNPNCKVFKEVSTMGAIVLVLRAVKSIDKGEELTRDYGYVEMEMFGQNAPLAEFCLCKEDKCVGCLGLGSGGVDMSRGSLTDVVCFNKLNPVVKFTRGVEEGNLEEVLDEKCPERHGGMCFFVNCSPRSECQLHPYLFDTRCASSAVKRCFVCQIRVCKDCNPVLHPNGVEQVEGGDGDSASGDTAMDIDLELGGGGEELLDDATFDLSNSAVPQGPCSMKLLTASKSGFLIVVVTGL
jgi:hypothetical protein